MATSPPSPKDHHFRQPSDLSGRCAVPDCGGYMVEHLAPLKPAQPAPTGNGPEVLPVVLERLQRRAEHGRKKYGTPLRAFNGRDALQDAIDEADDQQAYLTQLQMQWPALEAKVRHDALEEALQLVEVALQEEGADPATELGRTVAAVNGALRRLHADLRGLQGKPPAAPEPVQPRARGRKQAGRKQHRWDPRERGVDGRPEQTEKYWKCKDCPLERHVERGPQWGHVQVLRLNGREVARGPQVRVPPCPGQRVGT